MKIRILPIVINYNYLSFIGISFVKMLIKTMGIIHLKSPFSPFIISNLAGFGG